MRKDRGGASWKEFRRMSGNSDARQSTCRANPGQTDNDQLRISGRVWTVGALATLGGEFTLLAAERTRSILAALKTASVLGLLILSMASIAAGQRNSPGRPEQGPTTPGAVFGVSGVVLDPSNAAIAGAKVTLRGGSLENEPSTTTDPAGHFQFSGVSPGSYEVEVQREGFKILRSRVKVGPHPLAPLRIVLPLAELHEEVTATDSQGQLSREATENADIVKLDREALDSLPILDNDVVRAVTEMLGPASGGSGGPVL